MSILIVGGDRLGKIPDRLKKLGFTEIEHVTGRKKRDILRAEVFGGHKVVVVLTDFVNHELARATKAKAKEKGKCIIFARRAWPDIARALDSFRASGC